MEFVQKFDGTVNTFLNNFVRKPTLVKGIVHLLLILYAARVAPSLPQPVMTLFDNPYFKLFVFSLILWTAQFSPSTSILIALGFMITVNYANKKPLWEFLDNTDAAPPVAPSKDTAIQSAVAVVNSQTSNTPVVQSVSQTQDTVVIQPSVVSTPNGPAVVNPTVVIAPAVVSTPSGETIVVQPDVTTITHDAAPAPADAAPTAAPTAAAAPAATGCYPTRKYDLSKLSAYEYGVELQTI